MLSKPLQHSTSGPVIFVAALGIAFSIAGCLAIRHAEGQRIRAKAESAAEDRIRMIQRETDEEILRLRALRALFGASGEVTADEFDRFVSESAPRPERGQIVEWWPSRNGGIEPASCGRAYAHPRMQPNVRTERTPALTAAMARARESGEPTAVATDGSPAGEYHGAPDLMIMMPVYRVGARKPEYPANLRGYIISTHSLGAMMERGITYLTPGGLDVTVLGISESGRRLLHFHPSRKGGRRTRPQANPDMRFTRELNVAGRSLAIVCDTAPGYVHDGYTNDGWIILGLGVLATVLGCWWLRVRLVQVDEIERLVHRRTEQLAAARDEALQASKLKSQFLANVSHEVRTPLNGILGMTGFLLESDLNKEQRAFAQTIQHSSNSLLTIINDLLDMSRIEKGKLSIHPAPFSIVELVRGVVESVEANALAKGLTAEYAVHDALPSTVIADQGRLRQVLLNLLNNAIKFTETGKVGVKAALSPDSSGFASVRFEVYDTGIGIAPDAQEMIFRRFAQADGASTRRHGGLGLGLAISREIVSLMGGAIGVTSAPGAGSTFWFTARIDKCPPQEPVTCAMDSAPGATDNSGAPPERGSVLLVEDNSVNRRVAHHMLVKLGYSVHPVADGREAVQAAVARDYTAILMDCQMPEMDGFEATRLIRGAQGQRRRTPIIALTANAMKEDRERCLAIGMDDYLAKPIQITLLAAVLDRWGSARTQETHEQPRHETVCAGS